jgi:endoglycosylceramidase
MRSWSAILSVCLATAACSSKEAAPKPYQPTFGPVDSDGRVLRDERGRALLLRGANARVAGVFDVTFSDGREPRELIPSMDANDVVAMRAAGFTMIRLPINWSALEPVEGQYDAAYLDRIAAVVDLFRGSGIYVLLDLHEDGFSKELCEDGAPLWAIRPPLDPSQLVGGPGPLGMAPDCHASTPALAAFANFFADVDMLQEKYAAMAAALARRFAGDTQVLGYEVMNEPIGDDRTIAVFSQKIAAAIRAVDAKHLVLFEPSASRNRVNFSPISSQPFSVPGSVYSVHIYTAVFSNDTALADGTYPPQLRASITNARDEADGWQTPLMITEYGIGSTNPRTTEYIGHLLEDADSQMASTALWLWKEQSQGEWGLYTHNADDSWSPRPVMFDAVGRARAQAIGGDPTTIGWDGGTLRVGFTSRADVPAEHDIFWPGAAPAIACDDQPVAPLAVDDTAHRYIVACGGGTRAHLLTFR